MNRIGRNGTGTIGRFGAVAIAGAALVGAAGVFAGFGAAERGASVEGTVERAGERVSAVYAVDPVHTSVLFQIRHKAVANFYGRFNEVSGKIDYDADDFTNSTLSFEIPIASVDTNSKTRDGHLRDAEFFNARQYPKASFESSSISRESDGVYTLRGDLTLHGVTREIEAQVTDVRAVTFSGTPLMGFEARFEIQRSDFEIMKYLASDLSDDGPLGNTVEIVVAVEAVND